MNKRLVIADYDPRWPARYQQEKELIVRAIGSRLVSIEHIGSTAVPGLAAKPIIDVMAGVPKLADADACIPLLDAAGYAFVAAALQDLPDDRYFERWTDGYERGVELAHLHLTEYGSAFWREHVLLRDFLRRHPDQARQYERLKRGLAPRHTRGSTYAAAKTAFIQAALAQAHAEQQG